MTTTDNKLEAVVVAALVVTSVIAGFATIPAGTTVAQEQEESQSVQDELEMSDDSYATSDRYTIGRCLCEFEHSAEVDEDSATQVADHRAHSDLGAAAVSSTTRQGSEHWTAPEDSEMVVSDTYHMSGEVKQERRGSGLDGAATRVVVITNVVIYDETANEIVEKETVKEYDTLTPTPKEGVIDTLITAFQYIVSDQLSRVPVIGDEVSGIVSSLVIDEATERLDHNNHNPSIDETRTVDVTFEAEEGHEYSVDHQTIVVAGGIQTLNDAVEAEVQTESTVESIEVREASSPSPSPSESTVSVNFDGESSDTIQTDESTTGEIQMDVPESGLSGAEFTVRLSDSDVAEIGDVSTGSGFEIESSTGATQERTIQIADLDDEVTGDDGTVTLAEVEIDGAEAGSTDVEVDVEQMDDDNGDEIETTTESGTVEVLSLPPVVGSDSPTDPDGDGQYEDVNGNERLDFNDVVVFFQNMDSDVVTSNVDKFDYNENGRIDFDDVVTLFTEVTQ